MFVFPLVFAYDLKIKIWIELNTLSNSYVVCVFPMLTESQQIFCREDG